MSKVISNPRGPNMATPKKRAKKGTFKRLVGYVMKFYKPQFILVLVCIALNALATAIPGIFQQKVLASAEEGLGYVRDGMSTAEALNIVLPTIVNSVLVLIDFSIKNAREISGI